MEDNANIIPRSTALPASGVVLPLEVAGHHRAPPPVFGPPPTIQCGVNFRAGEPTRTCRELKRIRDVLGGIPHVPFVTAFDDFDVLSARIMSEVGRIRIHGEKYEWASREIFLKPFHNSPQAKFQPLDDTCLKARIEKAWKNEATRIRGTEGVVVHLFVYLTLETLQTKLNARVAGGENGGRPFVSTQRGTTATFARARTATDSHNDLEGVKPISAPLVHRSLAKDLRRNPYRPSPESKELSVSTHTNYRQAESSDRQRDEQWANGALERTGGLEQSAVIEVELVGIPSKFAVRIPSKFAVRIPLYRLREALGLTRNHLSAGMQNLGQESSLDTDVEFNEGIALESHEGEVRESREQEGRVGEKEEEAVAEDAHTLNRRRVADTSAQPRNKTLHISSTAVTKTGITRRATRSLKTSRTPSIP